MHGGEEIVRDYEEIQDEVQGGFWDYLDELMRLQLAGKISPSSPSQRIKREAHWDEVKRRNAEQRLAQGRCR